LTTTAGVTLSEARRIRDLHFSQFREMTKRMFSVGCGQYPYASENDPAYLQLRLSGYGTNPKRPDHG
jgi:hypothetical protein